MSQQPSDDNQNKKDLANNVLYDNMGMFKFAAIFLVLWWVLNYLYNHYFLDMPLFEHYLNLCVSLVKELLNLTGEQIDLGHLPNSMLGEIRSHDGAVVRFGEGTDGLMIMAALVAAIVAWPGSLLKKIAAVVLSVITIFILNIMRVAAMLKVDVYFPLQFDVMNTWVLPGALVLGALGCFLLWIKVSGQHPFDDNPT
jgi:exosortase/archaeosortase family protein